MCLKPRHKSIGTKYIHFTGGGEPFINDDIFEYLDYCTQKKYFCRLFHKKREPKSD